MTYFVSDLFNGDYHLLFRLFFIFFGIGFVGTCFKTWYQIKTRKLAFSGIAGLLILIVFLFYEPSGHILLGTYSTVAIYGVGEWIIRFKLRVLAINWLPYLLSLIFLMTAAAITASV